MARLDDDRPFLEMDDPLPPEMERLNKPLIYSFWAVMGIGLLVIAYIGVLRLTAPPPPPVVTMTDPKGITSQPPPVTNVLKDMPSSFAGMDTRPPVAPEPPPAPVAQEPMFAEPPAPPAAPPPLQVTPPAPGSTPGHADTGRGLSSVKTPSPATPEKPKTKRYMFAGGGTVGKSPFQVAEPTSGIPGGLSVQEPPSKLIKSGVTEQPAHMDRTWYRSMGLVGVTARAISSELGGDVHIRITEPLLAKHQTGRTLVPQHALAIGKKTGELQQGSTRLDITVEQIELPNGSLIELDSKASDDAGSQGLTGNVHNHWGRILASAGITALLSIGTRLPGGNAEQGQFFPSMGQQTGNEIAGSLSRSGNDVVRRQLDLKPTIDVPLGMPVTIYPNVNIQLHNPIRIVK